MKTITQIAKECNIDRDKVNYFVKKNNIVPAKIGIRRIKMFDKYQENYIHENLDIQEVILNSKINR